MFLTIKQFTDIWQQESDNTRKILAALTDESLDKQVAKDHRTLGRMAWHIVLTLSEMGSGLGIEVDGPPQNASTPSSVEEIQHAYDKAAKSLLESVTDDWDDDRLKIEVEMYGQKFTNGFGLWMAVVHEIHHRAQMIVLMRQAVLKVPGLYGPSYEEWQSYGTKPPAI